ncbi:MAG: putative nucleotide-diphospho-sugar transferase [Hyphomicrobiaceae bacterium]
MNYVVCGWYTQDYSKWVPPLLSSLNTFSAPHDFIQVEKADGGWERNTLRKPAMIEQAMVRHPQRTVIFLDVDALLLGPLDVLADIEADVALYFAVKRKANGNHALFARSGTIVLRPTSMARQFVRTWGDLSREAPLGWVDQSTLLEALWRTSGMTIRQLDVRYCATRKDQVADPVVLHEQGSTRSRKMPPWLRGITAVAHQLGARSRFGIRPGN